MTNLHVHSDYETEIKTIKIATSSSEPISQGFDLFYAVLRFVAEQSTPQQYSDFIVSIKAVVNNQPLFYKEGEDNG